MRKLLIALAFFAVVIAIGIGPTKAVRNSNPTAGKSPIGTRAETSQNPPGTIDGAVRPDLVPDELAYALFFNFVAGRVTKEEKNSLTSYLRSHQLESIDVDGLISVSNAFQRGSRSIDDIAGALSADALKQRKVSLANEFISSLPARIGSQGADSLRRHVTEYMKAKVRIIPGPPMPSDTHPMN